jgi:hypothetical protein
VSQEGDSRDAGQTTRSSLSGSETLHKATRRLVQSITVARKCFSSSNIGIENGPICVAFGAKTSVPDGSLFQL